VCGKFSWRRDLYGEDNAEGQPWAGFQFGPGERLMKPLLHVLMVGMALAGCQSQSPTEPDPGSVPSTGGSAARGTQTVSLPKTVPLPELFGKPQPTRPLVTQSSNPSGTWRWSSPIDNDTEYVLRLEVQGNRATGTVAGRKGREAPIFDAYFVDGELTFRVSRERNDGERSIWKYSGRVSGDIIRGTMEYDFGNGPRKRDWEAVREKS
jgi:hypothetical protein